jgi:hypothetical protein
MEICGGGPGIMNTCKGAWRWWSFVKRRGYRFSLKEILKVGG